MAESLAACGSDRTTCKLLSDICEWAFSWGECAQEKTAQLPPLRQFYVSNLGICKYELLRQKCLISAIGIEVHILRDHLGADHTTKDETKTPDVTFGSVHTRAEKAEKNADYMKTRDWAKDAAGCRISLKWNEMKWNSLTRDWAKRCRRTSTWNEMKRIEMKWNEMKREWGDERSRKNLVHEPRAWAWAWA